MTSNQINYWKNVETERANKAREAETRRHDTQEESIAKEKNSIESWKRRIEERDLDLKQQQQIYDLIRTYIQNGYYGVGELPYAMQEELASAFGMTVDDLRDRDISNGVMTWWNEVNNFLSSFGGGKGLSVFF